MSNLIKRLKRNFDHNKNVPDALLLSVELLVGICAVVLSYVSVLLASDIISNLSTGIDGNLVVGFLFSTGIAIWIFVELFREYFGTPERFR